MDSEPELKKRNMKDDLLDADDPELVAAAEILFKSSSETGYTSREDEHSARSGR